MSKKKHQKIVPMSSKPAAAYAQQNQPDLQQALLTQQAIVETAKKQEVDGQMEYMENVKLAVNFINDHMNEIADYVDENIGLRITAAPSPTLANPVYKRAVAVGTMKESRIHKLINYVCGTEYVEGEVPVIEALASNLIIGTTSDITQLVITTAVKRNPEILKLSFEASIEEEESTAFKKIIDLEKMYKEVISDDEVRLLYRKFLF